MKDCKKCWNTFNLIEHYCLKHQAANLTNSLPQKMRQKLSHTIVKSSKQTFSHPPNKQLKLINCSICFKWTKRVFSSHNLSWFQGRSNARALTHSTPRIDSVWWSSNCPPATHWLWFWFTNGTCRTSKTRESSVPRGEHHAASTLLQCWYHTLLSVLHSPEIPWLWPNNSSQTRPQSHWEPCRKKIARDYSRMSYTYTCIHTLTKQLRK